MKNITDQMLWDYVDGSLTEELAKQISSSDDELLQSRIKHIQQFNKQIGSAHPAPMAPSPDLKAYLLNHFQITYVPVSTSAVKYPAVLRWIFVPLAALCIVVMISLLLLGDSGELAEMANRYSDYILLTISVGFFYILSLFILNFIQYNKHLNSFAMYGS